MPFKFAGLWSGARSMQSSTSFKTLLSTRTDFENFSPPWTTRCPTALISEREKIPSIFKVPEVILRKI